jgi:hypothetical protein
MADGQVSVGGAFGYAWALLSQHWRSIWGALALNSLAWTVLVAGRLAFNADLMLLGLAGLALTKYPLYGAVVRAADAPKTGAASAHLGIQWRAEEFRMLGADVLFKIFMAIVAAILLIALAAPLIGILIQGGVDPKTLTTSDAVLKALNAQGVQHPELVALPFWLIIYAVGLRLSLSLVGSALSGRVAMLSTWRLTRGNLWRIAAASLLVNIPMIFALLIVVGGAAGGPMDGVTPSDIFLYALLTGVLAGAATTPMLAGVQLYFYKRLGPVPSRVGPEKA